MKRKKEYHWLITCYISREFLFSFLVAFVFFFMIFFVNSVLLLVQKIALKNINLSTLLSMVILSMPQFLIYTFPFATLSGASMVLGDMSSSNELLALRSSGISLKRVFYPILGLSLIFSVGNFIISDYLLPVSNIIYKQKLTVLMQDLPTFEIENNSINTVSNYLLSNGNVEGSVIEDITLANTDRSRSNMSIRSNRGSLQMVDLQNFVYEMRMDDPSILLTDSTDPEMIIEAEGAEAVFYLDFSSQVPTLTSTSPVNLSSKELLASIEERNLKQENDLRNFYRDKENAFLILSSTVKDALENSAHDRALYQQAAEELEYLEEPPMDFYAQYYKAELTKKIALSLACFFLTLVALPLGLLRLKYGKLTGFAISLLIAVAYWYMLFFAQLEIFDISSPPYLLIFGPNLVVGAMGILLLTIMRKAR